ncbi:heme-binding protein [Humibacillus sp. DSM 29435]|uniref:SOUL family heme-binding protein n=1 Tax=Humibacillus sp. DSM 29435 TaxID=1869167 RepID=UPI0008729490|nr:heme-binding protein [Humibacillus sp. DSM 29435]OFE18012.1 heme-binding protein [Humibacillus sp. DSM 29435]
MTEQQPYVVERTLGDVEVRRYPRHVVAQTTVTASFEDAGSAAFRRLASYIGGQNTAKANIAMTAPVTQEGSSQKIAMTAPVTQSGSGDRFVVAFVLPDDLTIDTAPEPTNPEVELREVPQRLSVAVTFSGRSSEQAFREHEAKLLATIEQAGLEPVGERRYARFDPPYKPWFLRRNEVVQDVRDDDAPPD